MRVVANARAFANNNNNNRHSFFPPRQKDMSDAEFDGEAPAADVSMLDDTMVDDMEEEDEEDDDEIDMDDDDDDSEKESEKDDDDEDGDESPDNDDEVAIKSQHKLSTVDGEEDEDEEDDDDEDRYEKEEEDDNQDEEEEEGATVDATPNDERTPRSHATVSRGDDWVFEPDENMKRRAATRDSRFQDSREAKITKGWGKREAKRRGVVFNGVYVSNMMNDFQYSRVKGWRRQQLECGAPPLVDWSPGETTETIAERELVQKRCPVVIIRTVKGKPLRMRACDMRTKKDAPQSFR